MIHHWSLEDNTPCQKGRSFYRCVVYVQCPLVGHETAQQAHKRLLGSFILKHLIFLMSVVKLNQDIIMLCGNTVLLKSRSESELEEHIKNETP